MSVWSVKWKGFMRDFTCSILEFHNLQLSESHLCLMQTAEGEWFLCVLSKCITLLAWGMLVWWGRLSAKSSLKRKKKKISTKECGEIIPKQIFFFCHVYILYMNLQILHKWHHALNSMLHFTFKNTLNAT